MQSAAWPFRLGPLVFRGGSRGALRRHLLHGAGLEVVHGPRDAIEISSSDTHEARLVRIINRVNRPILINPGLPRIEAIFRRYPEMRLSWIASVIYALELRHIGIRRSLAVNGPGGAMIVRRRDSRLLINVSQYLESKLRIVVQQMQP